MKTDSVTVRFARESDIDRIIEIERSWVHLSHWSVDAYHRLLKDRHFTTTLVAETESLENSPGATRIVGFVIFHATNLASEIYNIAVERGHARLGVGSALMRGVVDLSRGDGSRKLTLEVRKSNHSAIAFYRDFQFQIKGERLHYYANPVEDAYIMEKDLKV